MLYIPSLRQMLDMIIMLLSWDYDLMTFTGICFSLYLNCTVCGLTEIEFAAYCYK